MYISCKWLWLISLFLSTLLTVSNCNTITVDAHAEECFFKTVEADTKMGLTFEIIEGGFLDIDVKITGPDGAEIYRGERKSSGNYTFSAPSSGQYTYCFSNLWSTMTPKVVMFNLEVGDAPHKNTGEKEEEANHNKLEDMIKELGTTLKTVKHEQEYMQVIVFLLFIYWIGSYFMLKYIPARVLPIEWGGKKESIELLSRNWRHRVDEMRDYLRELSELCDVTPNTFYDNNICGAVGSFRKLDID